MFNGKVFYVHGLGGGLHSSTYLGLQEHFNDVECLVYPSETMGYSENLKTIADKFFDTYKGEKTLIVGTSLGGFFSTKLIEEIRSRNFDMNNLRLLIVNPAINPYKIGVLKESYPQELVATYKGIEISQAESVEKALVLAMDDELLDAQLTSQKLSAWRQFKFAEGGHSCWNTLGKEIIKIAEDLLSK